jgi:hypothetical protein
MAGLEARPTPEDGALGFVSVDALPLQCSAVAILILGYLILSRYLPKWVALLLATAKALVPFLYFGLVFPNGGWTLYDDVRYFDVGAAVLELGYQPWELVVDPEGRDLVSGMATSRHTLYYVWNATAQSIIGNYYYAAVFFNVALTFVVGAFMFRILKFLDFPDRFAQLALVFHMLHWDYLSWTSMINVKETLVETLVIVSLYSILRFSRRNSWPSLLLVAGAFMLLFSLRLYVPFLIMASTGVWVVSQWKDPRKYLLIPAIIGGLVFLYVMIGSYDHLIYPHLIISGGFHFLLTPQPWSITETYSFLQIPMIFQWVFFAPMLIGAVQLWQRGGQCRLLLLTLLTFIAFYSIFPAHQGPRHRVQIVALFALAEFQFIWSAVLSRKASHNHQRATAERPIATPTASQNPA